MTKTQKKALDALQVVYEKHGETACVVAAAYRFSHLIRWVRCAPCEEKQPHIAGVCVVCGTARKVA